MNAPLEKPRENPGPEADTRDAGAHALEVRDLAKAYGDTGVVNGLSFAIPRGTCFGLLGPNGAGKTTTLRMCLGLIEPDAGSIRLLDHAVPTDARTARARVGVVPQQDNIDPDFTVEENLLVYARYFGMTGKQARERIPYLLDFANLESKRDARIQTLSGGMKRRLTLARALVNDPDLVFLDEPTTGLDPQARHLIWERLRRLMNAGKTLLLTTHFMDEAERLCDTLAIIDHGRKIAEGSPRELIAEHIEPEVVEIYGDGAVAWMQSLGDRATQLANRIEQSGETVFAYTRDPALLMEDLGHRHDLRYMHRPANLEDVFIKLTGRELRD
ncbi:MAG TPA: ATP-binding cassette domain-containing protein [Burkholderiales bacterium]|jgi:lipooligosaccharide transport system ATP-binding protein